MLNPAYIPNVPAAMTEERLLELQEAAASGDVDAQREIIHGNMRRVIVVVTNFARKFPKYRDDLLGEALARLVRAVRSLPAKVENPDPSGYLLCAIKGACSDCMRASRLVGGDTRNGKSFMRSIDIDEIIPRRRDTERILKSLNLITDDRHTQHATVADLLSKFSESERRMIQLRMEDYTDEEIGALVNQSKLQIWQMRQDVKVRLALLLKGQRCPH